MSPTRFDHERLVEGEHEDAFLSRDVAEIQDFLGLERLGREAEVAAAGLFHEIDGLEAAVLVGLKEEKDNSCSNIESYSRVVVTVTTSVAFPEID